MNSMERKNTLCQGLLVLLVLTLILGTTVSAADEPAGGLELYEDDARSAQVAGWVRPLIAQHFPDLARVSIRIKPFRSEDSFFRTSVKLTHVVRKPLKRTYILFFNRRLFEDPPPLPATKAILVHELAHIHGYTRLSAFKLIRLARRYVTSRTFVRAYERETDEAALERRVGPGLKAYRLWLYPRLTPEQLEEKRLSYYTPEEIDAWMEEGGLDE